MEEFEQIENIMQEVDYITHKTSEKFSVIIELLKLTEMKELNRNLRNLELSIGELRK